MYLYIFMTRRSISINYKMRFNIDIIIENFKKMDKEIYSMIIECPKTINVKKIIMNPLF